MGISFEDAVAAHEAGDFEIAERGYLQFLNSRNAINNLGMVYRAQARFAEAEAQFRLIVEHYPDLPEPKLALATCLLGQRRYAEAGPLYEMRRAVLGHPDPVAGYPEWRGEPLAGRKIVVVPEQGFGDQIMFGRCLPLLRAAGAEVVFACNPRHVARLFERAGFATWPYMRPDQALPTADYWVFVNSLPWRLGLDQPAPAEFLGDWPGGGGGIGVNTNGNPAQQNDRNRSMTPEAGAQLRTLGRDLSPLTTGALDFLETAEIIVGLDLVITVDTSVAHLAASMGKPCWVLLTARGMCWRYNDGVKSDWYPKARLFRQSTAGDWSGVLDRVKAALAAGEA